MTGLAPDIARDIASARWLARSLRQIFAPSSAQLAENGERLARNG
jgi:hypothetical protein